MTPGGENDGPWDSFTLKHLSLCVEYKDTVGCRGSRLGFWTTDSYIITDVFFGPFLNISNVERFFGLDLYNYYFMRRSGPFLQGRGTSKEGVSSTDGQAPTSTLERRTVDIRPCSLLSHRNVSLLNETPPRLKKRRWRIS